MESMKCRAVETEEESRHKKAIMSIDRRRCVTDKTKDTAAEDQKEGKEEENKKEERRRRRRTLILFIQKGKSYTRKIGIPGKIKDYLIVINLESTQR